MTGIFTTLSNQYDPAIATGVNTAIQNGISGNAQTITEAMTVYVVIFGSLMMFREISWAVFMRHVFRAVAVTVLMTVSAFNQLIAVPAMTTIPDWIAQTVNNSTSITAGPQQFDLLWSAVEHQTAAIYLAAVGWENLGYRLEAAMVNGMIGFILLICYGVWEFSRSIMGLLVAAAPFLIFFALFDATRSIPMNLFNKMVGILILQLLLSIALQIMLGADAQIMVTQSQAALAAGETSLDTELAALWGLLLMFAFGLGMVVFIPSIAAYIGGGVAMSVAGSVMSVAGAGVMAARRGAGAIGRAGSRAVSSARGRLSS